MYPLPWAVADLRTVVLWSGQSLSSAINERLEQLREVSPGPVRGDQQLIRSADGRSPRSVAALDSSLRRHPTYSSR